VTAGAGGQGPTPATRRLRRGRDPGGGIFFRRFWITGKGRSMSTGLRIKFSFWIGEGTGGC
jgi:hypothetical protein